MFEKEIKEYEDIRKEYQQKIADRMSKKQWMEYNEVLFSTNSRIAQPTSLHSKRFAPKAPTSSLSPSSSKPPLSE